MPTTYGYARQHRGTGPRAAALRPAGRRLPGDGGGERGGADRTRPGLGRLRGRLRRGDAVVVVRTDCLARSLAHLLEVLDQIRATGAHFRSLSDPIDTASPTGRLVLQVIGAIAEFECNLIAVRTRAGLGVARARGRPLANPALRAGDRQAWLQVPTSPDTDTRHLTEDAGLRPRGGACPNDTWSWFRSPTPRFPEAKSAPARPMAARCR
ncbi:recombinase family protein [Muricoccus radiodurans]|uniref:recombinase family protein n=1 Tax=Muricoccus radiodurans TaxID=2231721 RepID=UPI003CEE90AA